MLQACEEILNLPVSRLRLAARLVPSARRRLYRLVARFALSARIRLYRLVARLALSVRIRLYRLVARLAQVQKLCPRPKPHW